MELEQKICSVPIPMYTEGFVAKVQDMEGSALFNLHIPSFSGTTMRLRQTVHVIDMNAYKSFAGSLLSEVTVKQRLLGSTNVKILGRNLHLDFNKTLSLGGLQDLTLSIDSVSSTSGRIHSSSTITYRHSQVSFDFGMTNFTASLLPLSS